MPNQPNESLDRADLYLLARRVAADVRDLACLGILIIGIALIAMSRGFTI
jgi:hypothetical protein